MNHWIEVKKLKDNEMMDAEWKEPTRELLTWTEAESYYVAFGGARYATETTEVSAIVVEPQPSGEVLRQICATAMDSKVLPIESLEGHEARGTQRATLL